MSKRFTNHSRNYQVPIQRPTTLRPGMTGKNSSKFINQQPKNIVPLSHTAKRNAYDKIKKIQAVERQKGSDLSFDQLIKEVQNIIKDDVEIRTAGVFPGEYKSENGRAILSDGTFYLAFAKIVFKFQYLNKKKYLAGLRENYLPFVTENKTIFVNFLEDEEEKVQNEQKTKIQAFLQKENAQKENKQRAVAKIEQVNQDQLKSQNKDQASKTQQTTFKEFATMTSGQKETIVRKPCIKSVSKFDNRSARKSVRWSEFPDFEESTYMREIVVANKQLANKEKKEKQEKQRIEKQQQEKKDKIQKIRKRQSFLIDFFEINNVYDVSMVEIIGIVNEIDTKYSIMIVKQKEDTEQTQSEPNTSNENQQSQKKKKKKEKREMIALGLMREMGCNDHDLGQLKQIEQMYDCIQAYVDIENYQDVLFKMFEEDIKEEKQNS